MDSKLRAQIKSNLVAFSQTTSQAVYNDPRTVLEYIQNSCDISLKSIWANIEANLGNLQDSKDVFGSRAAFDEATFLLDQLQIKQDSSKSKYGQQKLKTVLELIDYAIINCPSSSLCPDIEVVSLSEIYALRAKALLEVGQGELALGAIKEALRLGPSSPFSYNILVQILGKDHLNRPKEALSVILTALDRADYPRAAEEAAIDSPSADFFSADFVAHLRSLENSILEELGDRFEISQMKLPSYKKPKSDKQIVKNFSIDYRCQIGGQSVSSEANSKGRLFAATDTIPSGTTIFRESTYSLVLAPEMISIICAFCFRNVANRFVPCDGCTGAVYCSPDCGQLHSSSGHQFSCRLSKYLTNRSKSTTSVFTMLNRMGVKSVLKTLEEDEKVSDENGGNSYDMLTYSSDPKQRFTPEVEKDDTLRRQQYKAQMTLFSHYEKYLPDFLYSTIINAIDCAILASLAQGLSFEQLSEANLVKLICHCFVSIRRVLTNGFRWSSRGEKSGSQLDIATCYNLIGSLFNHACSPNAEWSIVSGVLSVLTLREVQVGEELTISYGPTADEPLGERQKRLLEGYFFQCNCSQCIKDCQKETVLKCTSCTGPILNSTCLVCSQIMVDVGEKVNLLQSSLADLKIKTKLLSFLYKSVGPEKVKLYNESLRQSLQTIMELIYLPSSRFFECLYKTSKVLYQSGNVEECLVLGELVDCLMPLKPTADLIVLGPNGLKNAKDGNVVMDVNLDYLIFWCSVYQKSIERTGSTDGALWGKLLRFNARFKKLLKLVMTTKEGLLADVKENKDSEWAVLRQEVDTLEKLKLHKAAQLAALKANFTSKKIDFDKLEAEFLGA